MTTSDPEPDPLEIELKLHVPAEARASLERHPALSRAASPPREIRQVATYYDTPDLLLAGKGFALRVREADGRRVQTLKHQGGASAAWRRGEWEWPIETEAPDLGRLADTPLGRALSAEQARDIGPVFTTDIRRTVRNLRLDDGTAVEAALDEGIVRAGSSELPVRELELELKAGSVASLYRLALSLQADLPLRLEPESKSARGYRLREKRPPRPIKAERPTLANGIEAATAFRQIIVAELGALLGNMGAAAVEDVEGVHQARVAIRRLRAALVLFEPRLEPRALARFEDELRRWGQVLGEARDWDVFCSETLPTALGGDDATRAQPLLQRATAARAAAHGRLREELARPALTSLTLSMAAWAEEGAAMFENGPLNVALKALAPSLLDRVERKVRKRGRHMSRRSGDELHAVRKSLKKLRYAVEFVEDLYDHGEVKAYLTQCKGLQELLGTINDAHVAVTLAERVAGDSGVELAPAVAAVLRWSERRRREAAGELGGAWHEFRDAKRFWR